MSERKNVYVASEEIEKQKQIIGQIRAINDKYYNQTGKTKTAYVVTYGCQQNENDTERIRGMLADAGYSFVDDKTEADLILYNTCAVRENAEHRVFGNLGALKHYKARKPNLTIAVCGCMMQQEHIANQVKKKYPHTDIIFGTHALYKFPEMLFKSLNERKLVIDIENSEGKIAEDIATFRTDGVKAWVSIMYGCNNFCAYCIVPYVRGRERSRRAEDIIKEITTLVNEGYKEITLLGQNVNSYGNDLEGEIDFADLLSKINEIKGLKRIRFMTSHPKDISDKLIETMAKCENVCRQLHLPFQAGSNNVLKLMNRKYTREEYLEKINKVKKAMPDISLSTDVIVGFPSETNEDFEGTLSMLKEAQFDIIYSFIYSKRKGTPAEKMPDVITEKEKHINFDKMMEVQNEISKARNQKYVGKVCEVLVEGESKNDKNVLTGRTNTSKIVNFEGDISLKGQFVNVEIISAHTWSLNGKLTI